MLKFPLNEFYRDIFGKDNFTNLLFSGISAGLTQTAITYPLDVMRTRMTIDNQMTKNYNGYIKCCKNIIKNEGIGGLYKGLVVNFTTYPLYVGLQFSIYETCIGEDFGIFSGAIAGVIDYVSGYGTQMQINGLDNTDKKVSGLIDCIKFIHEIME